MNLIIEYWWTFVWISLGMAIVGYWIMATSVHHLTYDRWTTRTFSIMDLEFPSSARYYAYIMTSLRKMENAGNSKPLRALRKNLYWDFLFMFGLFPFIALLCFHVASLGGWSSNIFMALALLQLPALILDMVENIVIFRTLKIPKLFIRTDRYDLTLYDDEQEHTSLFRFYKGIVKAKWIIALTGLILSLIAILYVLIFTERYQETSLWLGIITIIVVVIALFIGWKLQSRTVKKQ